MGPLALLFLRRLAVAALVLAVVLTVGPRLLLEFGVWGPGIQGEIRETERAIASARAYGALDSMPALADASRELSHARVLAEAGERRAARRAALDARRRAFDAQRMALSEHEEQRRRAQSIVGEIDRGLNELEDLYTRVTPGLDKQATRRLLSLMKETRESGAGLSLAFEQGHYERVLADEVVVRKRLGATRDELRALRMP